MRGAPFENLQPPPPHVTCLGLRSADTPWTLWDRAASELQTDLHLVSQTERLWTRRWSVVRWTPSLRSFCLASLPCSRPSLPPLLPLLLLPPPPLRLLVKLSLLPKKEDLASEDGPFSDQWTNREQKMTRIIVLLFDMIIMIMLILMMHLVKILIYFFDMCIIFASLPYHSATRLSAVLQYVQCVRFPAGFGLFLFRCLVSRLLQFLGNQGCDITSDITRLTFKVIAIIHQQKSLKT